MKKYKIAITGGIGCGKSTALNVIENLGYTVLSADKIVSEMYEKKELKLFLKSLFPTAVGSEPELRVNRKIISDEVFLDKEKHKKLTDTVTRLVIEEIDRRMSSATQTIFAEIPLLFECKCESMFDKIIVLTRDKEQRIKSVCLRSGLSRTQIEARMNNQVDYDKIDLSPYVVIENDGSTEDLKNKLTQFIKSL